MTIAVSSGAGFRPTTNLLWCHSPSNNPPLRIGLLLDSPELSRFARTIIEDIQSSNFANIELAVLRKERQPSTKPPASSAQRLLRRLSDSKLRSHVLYDLYLRWDQKMRPRNHPLEQVDCSDLLSGVEKIEVEPIGQKFVHRFPPDAIEAIRAKDLDVLIRFGFNILKGEILTAARYGVWSYHHGDNDWYRGGPALLWELCEKAPLSGVLLQILTEQLDAGLVLCKSLFATQATLSVSVNRFGPYWGASDLMIRKLNELHRFGWEYLKAHAVPPVPYRGKRKLYRSPTNVDMIRWLAPVMLKKAVQRPFRRHQLRHWRIGVRMGRTPLFQDPQSNFDGLNWIESPSSHFWADPFLLRQEGKTWVFFEDYCYASKRGRIACAEMTADGKFLSPITCLEDKKHHYSYPYIFRDGESLFMVPEAMDSNAVVLYRCKSFPDKWEPETTLLQGRYVDTSIWKSDGLWWMLTTSADPDSRASSLLLFFGEHPHGPWQFHPANPISADVRNHRGAGRIFWTGERWIRPSQSACPVYGYSFTLNEITELSPETYSERPIREFRPDTLKGIRATHTYNWIEGVELIDGTTMRPAPRRMRCNDLRCNLNEG